MTLDTGLFLAVVSAAFSAGVTVAALRGKASKLALARTHRLAQRALGASRRAHIRLDELEGQTGTRTALRPTRGDLATVDEVGG